MSIPAQRLLVGSYTGEHDDGLPYGVVPVRNEGGMLAPDGLALDLPSPSYLLAHPAGRLVYALSETDDPALLSIAVDRPVDVISRLGLPGRSPCHLALTPDRRHMIVANYGDGTIVGVRLDDSGRPIDVAASIVPDGSGPHPRQDGPHAHHVLRGPDETMWVTDLGADLVRRIEVGSDGSLLQLAPAIVLPAGTGPRQTRVRPDGRTAYVLGELSGELLMAVDGEVVDRRLACISDPDGENLPAHLMLDGDILYVSHRGLNCIAVFDVSGTTPAPVTEIPTGQWPRHFALRDGWLYVADQKSDQVTARRIGATEHIAQLPVRQPSCILPIQ